MQWFVGKWDDGVMERRAGMVGVEGIVVAG